MRKVVLMVGPYGSGKSQKLRDLIRELPAGTKHTTCSSSFFFLKNGVYKFEAAKLSEAFTVTRKRFVWALHQDFDVIFIDDNHLKFQYRKFYLEQAIEYGYEIEMWVMPKLNGIECDLQPGFYRLWDGEEDIEVEYIPDPSLLLPTEMVLQPGDEVKIGKTAGGTALVGPGPDTIPTEISKPEPTIIEDPTTGNLKRFNGKTWDTYILSPKNLLVVKL